MPATFNSTDDIIDLRDVIARIEQLEALRQPGSIDLGNEEDNEADQDSLFAELATLETFIAGLKGAGGDEQWRGDWYPVTLIARSYFVDYCKDLVSDIGDLPRDIPSYLEIDWTKTARNLEVDYSTVEFDGNEFLYR